MKQPKRKRTLAFEQLETKCAPASLLLVLAPLDDSFHVELEQSRAAGTTEIVCAPTQSSASWQFQFSTNDLVQFVHENTSSSAPTPATASLPTAEQCRGADEMMKLGDQDLRALVIADSLQHS